MEEEDCAAPVLEEEEDCAAPVLAEEEDSAAPVLAEEEDCAAPVLAEMEDSAAPVLEEEGAVPVLKRGLIGVFGIGERCLEFKWCGKKSGKKPPPSLGELEAKPACFGDAK